MISKNTKRFAVVFSFLVVCTGINHPPLYADTPAWYSGARVQIHTRMPVQKCSKDSEPNIFWHLPEQVRRMGVSVLTRHIKGGGEGAWWPSRVGIMDPRAEKCDDDLAAVLIKDAHQNGVKQIAYYRHMEDNWAAREHPEWRVLDRQGLTVKAKRSDAYMSFASPYADFVITRLVELAQRGADGFYFDEIHIPRDGDFSSFAQEKFKAKYDKDLLTASDEDALSFRQEIIAEFMTRATEAVHEINSEIVTLLSVNTLKLDVLRSANAPKYEDTFNNWLGGLESAATVLTDVGGGYPHLWRAPREVDSLNVAARYLAFGAIYNRDILGNKFFEIPHESNPSYADLFKLGQQISPAMSDVSPYRHVRVVVNGDLEVRKSPLDSQLVGRWRQLVNERIPAGYISFKQILEDGIPTETRVLVIPEGNGWEAPMDIPEKVQPLLQDFTAKGGLVLQAEDVAEGGWIKTIKGRGVPVTATGGSSDLGLVVYQNTDASKLVVNLADYKADDLVLKLSNAYFTKPSRIIESRTGRDLEAQKTENGWTIAVPGFKAMAQIVIKFIPEK